MPSARPLIKAAEIAARKAKALWGDARVVTEAAPWGTWHGGDYPYLLYHPEDSSLSSLYVPKNEYEDFTRRSYEIANQKVEAMSPHSGMKQSEYNRMMYETLAPMNREFYDRQRALGRDVAPQKFTTGEPVIVAGYHGSETPAIYEFKDEFLGRKTGANSARLGHFFAGSPETSGSYTGRIIPNLTAEQEMIHRIYALGATNPDFERLTKEAHRIKMQDIAIPDPDTVTSADELRAILTRLKPGFPLAGFNHHEMRGLLRLERASAELANPTADQMIRAIASTGVELPPMPAPTMYPVMLNMRNPLVRDWEGGDYRDMSYSNFLREAKDAGHDSAILLNTYDGGPQDNIFVQFDPTNIRSWFAKYDPANRGKADIMGAADPRILPLAAGAGAGAMYGMDEIDALIDRIIGGQ